MSNQSLVVLLAGLPGSGKSTIAPYLAEALNANLLETDDLFNAPRVAVGAALGIGPRVVDEPQWKEAVHGRLLSFFLALASTAATPEHPVVAVSPWTGFRQEPTAFESACVGLGSRFQWVIAACPPAMRRERIRRRGRTMDATKLAAPGTPDPVFYVPDDAITLDLSCARSEYVELAQQVAVRISNTHLDAEVMYGDVVGSR